MQLQHPLILLVLTGTSLLAQTTPATTSPAAKPKPETLPEVVVTTAVPEAYKIPEAASASKTDVPLMTHPVSVQVVPEQVIKDQRATTIGEAVKNVSGVRSNNNDLEGYVFRLRGFTSNFLYRNALPVSYSTATIEETANLERIEVIKGPASVLFGRIEPGGVINMVTKRPLDAPAYSLSQEIGSFDHYRSEWDFTGPLTKDASLSYRLAGAYQNSGSFRDFLGLERTFVNPVVTWKISEDTELTLEFSYLRNHAQSDMGFPAVGTRPADIPFSRTFQEPNDPMDRTESRMFAAEFMHRFNDDWKINSRFLVSDADLWKLNIGPTGLRADNRTLDRAFQHQWLKGRSSAFNVDLAGKFETFGLQHELLLGYDLLDDYYDYRFSDQSAGASPSTIAALPMDLYHPSYGHIATSAFYAAIDHSDSDYYSSAKVVQHGLYFQDHITIVGQWHALLAGRYDFSSQPYGSSETSSDNARDNAQTEKDHHFTPQFGLLYQPKPWVSLYGSYAESFGVNNGNDAQGNSLPPEQGRQYEVGLKFEMLDKKLTATLAGYHLIKENILTDDPSTADPTDSKAVGETRSKGLELDVVGQITDRLGIIGSYAYTDAEFTRDNSGLEGNRVATVPLNSGSLSLAYDFRNLQTLDGWRAGISMFASGGRAGDNDNTFTLPGYTRFDVFASYSRRISDIRWTAQLNVTNLADRNYIEGVDSFYNNSGRTGMFPGAGRAFAFSIKAEF